MTDTYQEPELHFLWLEVDALSVSVDFYRDTLGLPVQDDAGAFATVHLGNTKLHLAQGMPRGMGMQIAIAVPDIDNLLARMRKNGLAVAAPIDEGWARYVNVTDPNGYRLVLLQPAASAPIGSDT